MKKQATKKSIHPMVGNGGKISSLAKKTVATLVAGALLFGATANAQEWEFDLSGAAATAVGDGTEDEAGTLGPDPFLGAPLPVRTGILLDGGTVGWFDGTEWTRVTGTGSGPIVYDFDAAATTITGVAGTGSSATAVLALSGSASAIFDNIGNISISTTDDTYLRGFYFGGASFLGGIYGADVTVTTTGAGDASAIHFRNLAAGTWANIGDGGEVLFENVTATSTTGDAYGVSMGRILAGGSLFLHDVNATAGAGVAVGVLLHGGAAATFDANGDFLSGLAVDKVTAIADADATGILSWNGDLHAVVGEVNATARTGGWAAGIRVIDGGDAHLVLSDDITVNATTGMAFGIMVDDGNANIVLADDVTIAANGAATYGFGFHVSGDLNIDLAGFDLTSNSTQVGGEVNIMNSDEDFHGFADLGVLGVPLSKLTIDGEIYDADDNFVSGGFLAVTASGTITTLAGTGGSVLYVDDANATLTIGGTEGTFDGWVRALESGTLNINGGEFYVVAGFNDAIVNVVGAAGSTIDLGYALFSENAVLNLGNDDKGEGDFTVRLNVVDSDFGASNSINLYGNATLAGYANLGELVEEDIEDEFFGFAVTYMTDADQSNITGDLDEFHKWKVVEDSGTIFFVFEGFLGSANMSEGFVQALTMHNRYTAWNAVRDRMISGNGFNRSGFRGQAPCDPCNPCDPVSCFDGCGPRSFGGSAARGAWVNYIARSDAYSSNFHAGNWKLSTEGVQAGTDLFRSKNSQFGTLFGYESGRMNNAADRIKADDLYVGLYGAHVFRNGIDVRGVFAYGWQDYDMTRTSAIGDVYTSKFKGYTTETNLEFGRRLTSASGVWSLRPVIAVDVFNNNIKAATETGGANAVAYGKASLTQVFFRSGSDVRYQVRNIAFNGGLYYSYDINGQELNATANGVNLSGAKLGRELLTFNLGTDVQVTKNFSLFGGYQGEYAIDRDNSRVHSMGHVGAGFKW